MAGTVRQPESALSNHSPCGFFRETTTEFSRRICGRVTLSDRCVALFGYNGLSNYKDLENIISEVKGPQNPRQDNTIII